MITTQALTRMVGRTAGRTQRSDERGSAHVDLIRDGDAIVSADGVRIGTVHGLYEAGPLRNHLLVHGPADPDDHGSVAIYVVPLYMLDGHDGESRFLSLAASAAEARRRWLIDVF